MSLQIHSPASNSLGQLERLTGRIDDLEAKVAYCGSKMDTLLSECVCGERVAVCVC